MDANNGVEKIMKFNGREISIYPVPITYGICHFYDNDDYSEDDLDKDDLEKYYNVLCEVCDGEYLSPTYVYIINVLREADLLPEDYKLVCCRCYNKKYPDLVKKEIEKIYGNDY